MSMTCHRHGTAFRLKKYRNYRRIIAKIQANFQNSKNTGGNCHFTGNTGTAGITGGRAMPDVMSLCKLHKLSHDEKCESKYNFAIPGGILRSQSGNGPLVDCPPLLPPNLRQFLIKSVLLMLSNAYLADLPSMVLIASVVQVL